MRYTTKEIVFITTQCLNKAHCFESDVWQGEMVCAWMRYDQQIKSTVNFEISTVAGSEYIHFKDIEHDCLPGVKTKLDCMAKLDCTPCHFGGRRWWLICPMVANGKACNRRVGALYLPTTGTVFGCRRCCKLRYEKSRKSYYKYL